MKAQASVQSAQPERKKELVQIQFCPLDDCLAVFGLPKNSTALLSCVPVEEATNGDLILTSSESDELCLAYYFAIPRLKTALLYLGKSEFGDIVRAITFESVKVRYKVLNYSVSF